MSHRDAEIRCMNPQKNVVIVSMHALRKKNMETDGTEEASSNTCCYGLNVPPPPIHMLGNGILRWGPWEVMRS